MRAVLAQTVARIHSHNGKDIIGLGFLVTPDHVLTRTAIVTRALDIKEGAPLVGGGSIQLDFPMHISRSAREAHIVRSQGDIVLLKIEAESSIKQAPVALVKLQETQFADRQVAIIGFAEDIEQRLEANYVGINESGFIKLELSAATLLANMDGAPVWDSEEQGVTGQLVVEGASQTTVMVPVSALLKACPELDSQWRPANPYRGLRHFRLVDEALFFGRDHDVDELFKQLKAFPMCTLIGASGSGKTSLIHAGLLPKVQQKKDWLVLSVRPRTDPFLELAEKMMPYLSNEDTFEELEREKLHKELSYSRDALANRVQELLDRVDKTRVLLVIDQFEEVFTASDDVSRRERFLNHLLRLVASAAPVCVLISIRADYLSRILEFPLMSKVLDKFPKKTLGAMGPAAFRQVIEQPANQLGVQMEPELVKQLLDELSAEPRLFSLLEFYLTLLWEQQLNRYLPLAVVDEVGNIRDSLIKYVNSIMSHSTQFQRDTIKSILLKLVSTGHQSRCLFYKLAIDQFTADERELIPRLVDQRLLIIEQKQGEPDQVEIVHEMLLREWPELRLWVEDKNAFDVWRVDLKNWVSSWKKNSTDNGYLLHGKLQLEAEESLEKFTSHLSADEKKFIRAGTHLRKRTDGHHTSKQHVDKKLVTGLAAALAVVLGYSGWQWWQVKVNGQQVMELADQARSEIQKSHIRAEEMEKLASLTIRFLVEQNPDNMKVYVDGIQRHHSHNALKALIETSITNTESMRDDERVYWRGVIDSMDQDATAQLLSALFLKSDGLIDLDYAKSE